MINSKSQTFFFKKVSKKIFSKTNCMSLCYKTMQYAIF